MWLTGGYDLGDLNIAIVTAVNPQSLPWGPTYALRSHSPKLTNMSLSNLVCNFKRTWDIILKKTWKKSQLLLEKCFSLRNAVIDRDRVWRLMPSHWDWLKQPQRASLMTHESKNIANFLRIKTGSNAFLLVSPTKSRNCCGALLNFLFVK